MNKNDGGPAFPVIQTELETVGNDGEYTSFGNTFSDGGMTLRDYFAAKAMAALIGTATGPCMAGLEGYEPHTAAGAYRIADAMIAARGDA